MLSKGKLENVNLIVKRLEDRTLYEAAIPWNELAFAKVADDVKFGFSVLVNDADSNQTRAFLEWGGGIARTKDPRQFVPVRLEK